MRKIAITRRQFIKGTALAGASAALAACATPAPTAAPAKKVSGKLTYWHHYTSESEMAGLAEGEKMFKAKYPEATVESLTVPNADFMAKFTLAVQGGSGKPDTTMISADRVPDMVGMGGIQDLTERLKSWDQRKNYPDKYFDAATVNGKIYGVPSFMFVDWMYYRKDWFDEKGLKAPTTFDEMFDAAVKLTDPAKGRFGFGMRGGAGGQGMVVQVIRAFGSPIVKDGKAALDIAKTTEALKWYTELHTKAKAVPPSVTNDSFRQILEAFQTGKTGMLWHHTGSLADVVQFLGKDGTKFLSLPRPKGPAAQIADWSPSYNGIVDKKNEDAGWAWLTHWADKDTQIMLMEKTGYVPSNQEAAKDERITKNPYYTAAFKALESGTIAPQFPGQPGWQSSVVLPTFQRILLGELTPAAGATALAKGLEDAIAGKLK